MRDVDVDQIGPVDYVVVEFPGEQANLSDVAPALTALADSRTVRVLDLLLLHKRADGGMEACELCDASDSDVGRLRTLEADLAVLLGEEDIEEIGRMMEPGTRAAVLVWENRWAAPFGAAVRRAGGLPITTGRIPTQEIIAAITAEREASKGV